MIRVQMLEIYLYCTYIFCLLTQLRRAFNLKIGDCYALETNKTPSLTQSVLNRMLQYSNFEHNNAWFVEFLYYYRSV